MKTAVFVGLFVVVACMQLQADGAISIGETKDCSKEPEDIKNSCHRFLCYEDEGKYEVHTCGVEIGTCSEGEIYEKGAVDLSKPYPACCPRPYCRGA